MATGLAERPLLRGLHGTLVNLTEQGYDDWFISNTRHPDAEVTIAALPRAGDGCAAFAEQAKGMPDWLELATLNLPGRQARFKEPLRTEINPLVAELTEYWSGRPTPSILFGYCSGALIAYCVACHMQDCGAPMPRRLVVGSCKPPHCDSTSMLADLDSDTFWRVLVANHVLPPQIADHSKLRNVIETVIRADLALAGGYVHKIRPPLPIPITVFAGDQDRWISADDAAAWAEYTTQGFELRNLPAGHWFMEEAPVVSTAAIIAEAAAMRA
jgi:surfactin synthase thioesterase subunit